MTRRLLCAVGIVILSLAFGLYALSKVSSKTPAATEEHLAPASK